jgi:putative hydrolase of the HAD superfamily
VEVYAQAARTRGVSFNLDDIRTRLWQAYQVEEEVDRQAGYVTSEHREEARWRKIVENSLPGLGEQCFAELYAHFAQPSAWQVPALMAEEIARLAEQGIRLGLASNYDSRLLSVLAGKPELAPLNRHVVISSLVGYRKPAAEFFKVVQAEAGCPPEEILFVGDDRVNDYDGARAAGFQALLVSRTDELLNIAQMLRR